MERVVEAFGGCPRRRRRSSSHIAKAQNQLFGETQNFLAAREFRDLATEDQKRDLLHCLFAVSAADDSISDRGGGDGPLDLARAAPHERRVPRDPQRVPRQAGGAEAPLSGRRAGERRRGRARDAGALCRPDAMKAPVTLLHAAGLGLSFGSRTVFDGLTFTIEEGERVGLVGVNGSGKSSLMRMLARAAEPDRGEIQLRRGATVTYLPQEPAFRRGRDGRLRARGGARAAPRRARRATPRSRARLEARARRGARTSASSPSSPRSPTASSTSAAGTPRTRRGGSSTGSA